MYKHLIILPFILLSACRSTEGASEANVTKPQIVPTAVSQLLLKKVIGGLNKTSDKDQVFECKVMTGEVADLAKIQAWINEIASTPMVTAYHFVAHSPSLQIFAYQGEKEILVIEDASTRIYPKPNGSSDKNTAAEELIKIANEKCPTPSK